MKRIRAVRKDCWEMAQGWTHLPCIYEDQSLLEPTSMLGGHGCQAVIPTLRRQTSLMGSETFSQRIWWRVMEEDFQSQLQPPFSHTHGHSHVPAHIKQAYLYAHVTYMYIWDKIKKRRQHLNMFKWKLCTLPWVSANRGNVIPMGFLGLWNSNALSNASLLGFQMPDELNKCIGTLDSM